MLGPTASGAQECVSTYKSRGLGLRIWSGFGVRCVFREELGGIIGFRVDFGSGFRVGVGLCWFRVEG